MSIMNKKYQQALVHIINEEINQFLLEQDPNMPDPNMAQTDPNASPAGDMGAPQPQTPEDPEEKAKKGVEGLAAYSDDVDIKREIIDSLQDGKKREEMEDMLRYIEKYKSGSNSENKVPDNVLRVVYDVLVKQMGIKIPQPKPQVVSQQPAAATAAPQPLAESRLQKIAKEYLHYKKLYTRELGK